MAHIALCSLMAKCIFSCFVVFYVLERRHPGWKRAYSLVAGEKHFFLELSLLIGVSHPEAAVLGVLKVATEYLPLKPVVSPVKLLQYCKCAQISHHAKMLISKSVQQWERTIFSGVL